MQEVSCAAESGGCAFETGGSAGPQPHVSYLKNHEEEYSELLAQKTTRDYDRESQNRRQCLQELIAWNKEVDIGCLSTFTRTMYPAS